MKLIVSLLVICLVFSLGSTQAQTGGNNTSQTGNMSINEGISTLANKTINVSQGSGGDVKWILPGPRRLDPTIFGTPSMPLGFEEEIGVPIENRSVIDNGTEFNATKEDTPFSDNFSRINGFFTLNLTDMTPVDVKESTDTATATFNFTDPTGNIEYSVVLTNVTHVGQFHPVLGGVVIDGIAHGRTSIDTRLEPTSYVYGAVWGVGELYINGTLVSNNRVVHAMVTERIRSPDQQGYRLLFDNELPHQGIQAHLLLPDMAMSGNGTMVKDPVPTNYTLPNGEEQPFIHVTFDKPQLQGLKILNYMNATGVAGNMTGNQTGNMTGNQTGNMTGNVTGNQTGNMTGNQTGNMTGNITGNVTGNQTGSMTDNMAGNASYMPFSLHSIEGKADNTETGEAWFIYLNGQPAKQAFGMNNVSKGDNLSFWYTTLRHGEASIEDASYVVNIKIDGGAQNQTQTGSRSGTTVLYDNSVNLTEGTFNFTYGGSEHRSMYQLNNFTDMGALNATGLSYTASPMNMTEGSNEEDDR